MSDNATPAKPDAEAEKRQRDTLDKLLARAPVASTGSVTLAGGRRLDYELNAAFMPLTTGGVDAQRGEPQAAVFCVADMVPSDKPRPLCFAFNGGPGSASVWLHLGALGPKRVAIHDDGTMPAPPYAVQDNPLTWLEQFDLVFIDPPHTGYSIALNDDTRKKLFSVDGDADALHWAHDHSCSDQVAIGAAGAKGRRGRRGEEAASRGSRRTASVDVTRVASRSTTATTR